jgi:hypothetical protein
MNLAAGSGNTIMGAMAGYNSTNTSNNTMVGYNAGLGVTNGSGNTYIGNSSGLSASAASSNTFVGYGSGYNATGGFNTFIGTSTAYSSTTGTSNFMGGFYAGYLNTTGSNNVFLGNYAGYNNGSGINNICIGSGANVIAGLTNAIAIGANAVLSTSNTMMLGGVGIDAVKVGIGTSIPAAQLDIIGYTKLGFNAPNVQLVKITGTSPAAQSNVISINHGVNMSKIISAVVVLQAGGTFAVPPEFTAIPGYEYSFIMDPTRVHIYTTSSNSFNILSQPLTVLITYEE